MNQQFSLPKLQIYPKHPVFSSKDLETIVQDLFQSQNVEYIGEKKLDTGRVNVGVDFFQRNKDLDVGYLIFRDEINLSPVIMGLSEKYWLNQSKQIPQGLQFYSNDTKGRVSVPSKFTEQIFSPTINLYRGDNIFFIVPPEHKQKFPSQPSLDYYL